MHVPENASVRYIHSRIISLKNLANDKMKQGDKKETMPWVAED